jgi:hypothetical protein
MSTRRFEPMLLLVIGLPLASVIAGVSLVVTAVRSGNDDAVYDRVRRTAQIQVSDDAAADGSASARRLSALLRVEAGRVSVLPLAGAPRRDVSLQLVLAHPVDSHADREIALTPDADGWSAALALESDHDWLVRVESREDGWRLRGRLRAGERAAHLAPILEAR